MPANFPPEAENSLEQWDLELQLRSGQILDNPEEHAIFAEELGIGTEEFENRLRSLDQEELHTDRLPILNVSRQALDKAEVPQGFMDDLAKVSADYIDGFVVDQDISPASFNGLGELDEKTDSRAGSYHFRKDLSQVFPRKGRLIDGSSAATHSGHETMHKGNIEALVDDFERVRSYAYIFRKECPEDYHEAVEKTDVAPVNHDLVGGLALMETDPGTIIVNYLDGRPHRFDPKSAFEEFKENVSMVVEEYSAEDLDVRDETICQAVSFFMDGNLDDMERFSKRGYRVQNYYDDNQDYSFEAGQRIKANLTDFKSSYDDAEGTRGQRFKQVMSDRIPFLMDETDFT